MALPLALTVPLMADEPTTYYPARLAARNFLSVRPFAGDMGIDLIGLDRASDDAILRLSETSGVDVLSLLANASCHRDGKLRLRGQLIDPKTRRVSRFFICPACLEADVARGDLPPASAIHARIQWTVTSINTCIDHGMALVPVPSEAKSRKQYDWSSAVAPYLPNLAKLTDEAPRRPPSRLEAYLVGRLRGTVEECWLNTLEFHTAEQAALLFGRVALFGKNAPGNLTEDRKRAAGDAGFEIVKDGPESIPRFLSQMQLGNIRRNEAAGAGVAYGQIYVRLASLAGNAAFAAVGDIVRHHILENFPVGPGNQIFGKPVITRRFHTIYTLAKQFGMSSGRAEKALRSDGLLPEDAQNARETLIDAARAERVVEREMRSVNLIDAEQHIGATPNIMKALLDNGFLRRHRVSKGGLGLRFRINELEDFLRPIMEHAELTDGQTDNLEDLSMTCVRAKCSLTRLLELISDRKIWVGRRPDRSGLASLLVNVEEVRLAVATPTKDGLSIIEAGSSLQIAPNVLRKLADRMVIETFRIRDPKTGALGLRVTHSELARFSSTYVSIFQLSRTLRRQVRALRVDLANKGVREAEETVGLGTFYRRSELSILN